MSVAKGKFYLSKEQLSKMLLLPEGVEIMGVKEDNFGEGFEFMLISAEETKVTKKNIPLSQMRRSVIQIEEVPNVPFATGGIYTGGSISIGSGEKCSTSLNGLASENIRKLTSNQVEISIDGANINVGENVLKQSEADVQTLFENIVNGLRKKGS